MALVSMGSHECKKEKKEVKNPTEMRTRMIAVQTLPFYPSSPFYLCKFSPVIPYTDAIQVCVYVAVNKDLCFPLEAGHSSASIALMVLDQHLRLWFIYGYELPLSLPVPTEGIINWPCQAFLLSWSLASESFKTQQSRQPILMD